ncbi:sensor histidine kinase [Amphritea japonica]|uniref:C4-dicarboxylate transport sensor protein DctB n=1 Tax=Amphritea japonica ATCC BAA-1530 TaxID=1278309 RepID=A0A7R6PJQ1_9GAMM|nr:ATP-binding protein [Amphritea japonica]BBB25625.1 two-component system sensor histidine kinase [Amphritea japonica ATCC BAA-1530]
MQFPRFIPLITLMLVLSVIGTTMVSQLVRDWALTDLKERGENQLLSIISQTRSEIAEYQYLPFLVSQSNDVAELLRLPSPDKIARVSRYLEQTNLVAGTTALFVLDVQGRARAFSHWRAQQNFYEINHRNQGYFLQALEGQQGVQVALPTSQHEGAIYLSAPVYVMSRLQGVATVRLDLELLQTGLDQTGEYLFSKNEQVLMASKRFQTASQLKDIVTGERITELYDGSEIQQVDILLGGRALMQSVTLDDLGWQVSVFNDLGEVVRIQRNATFFAIALCIVISLLVFLLRERQLKHISRRETQQALERSEARQRDIINTAHVGMITLDNQGQVLFINPMAMQQFNESMQRIQGAHIDKLIAPEMYQGVLKKTLSCLGSKGFAPLIAMETVGKRSDHSHFPMLFSIKRMKQEISANYLVTVIDITPRKRLERALQEANDQLEHKVIQRTQALKEAQDELVQAEKMAALGRMSSAVVHELNQPLTALRTYIAICRKLIEQNQTAQLDNNLELINDLVSRMSILTRQLKTFAYQKPQHMAPVDPLLVLDQVLNLLRGRLDQQQVELVYPRPDINMLVSGDSARLEQIFLNLITNACDALSEAECPRLKIQVEHDKAQIKISVIDNGVGIDEQSLSHIFEPFFTTKEIGEGLGLGLSIIRSIVRDLQGDIGVASRADSQESYTCFTVTLPLLRQTGESQ